MMLNLAIRYNFVKELLVVYFNLCIYLIMQINICISFSILYALIINSLTAQVASDSILILFNPRASFYLKK